MLSHCGQLRQFSLHVYSLKEEEDEESMEHLALPKSNIQEASLHLEAENRNSSVVDLNL
jgi:hypothetical protein